MQFENVEWPMDTGTVATCIHFQLRAENEAGKLNFQMKSFERYDG